MYSHKEDEKVQNVINLQSITKCYGKKVALNNINLSIDTGKIIGLLGPNGSGKTTLIKTIMRIIREQNGFIKDIALCVIAKQENLYLLCLIENIYSII